MDFNCAKNSIKKIIYTVFFIFTLFAKPSYADENLYFGVFAYQSVETTTQQYQPLADYFSEQLNDYDVKIKVLGVEKMVNAVRNKQVDFILVNPNLHQIIRNEVRLSGITATQQKSFRGQALSSLGGVIFSRADNPYVKTPKDLRDTIVAVASLNHTGAFRIPLYELNQLGITEKQLTFMQVGNNDAALQAVLDGKAGAGFARTGIIEDWIDRGLLKAGDLHIINQKNYTSFPQLLSTRLYPEWPFITLPHVEPELTRQITVALYSLTPDHPALVKGGLAGFTHPQDYLPFENLLRELKLYPYDHEDISLVAIWHEYKFTITSAIVLFSILLFFVFFNEYQNKLITNQKEQLDRKSHIDEALLKLPQMARDLNEAELLEQTVEMLEHLTFSTISFIHFVDEDKGCVELIAWSKRTKEKYCHIDNLDTHYDIEKAGVWADAIRKKDFVLINDYPNYQEKNGLPDGHAHLERMLSVPVFEDGKVELLAGVGNKEGNYNKQDIEVMQLILNDMWRLVKEKRSNKIIQKQRTHYQHLLDNLGNNYMVFSHNGLEGVLTFASKGVESIFEQSATALIGTAWSKHIKWDFQSIEAGIASVKELAERKKLSNHVNMSFRTPSGQHKHLLIQQNGVYENNQLVAVEGLVTDITQRLNDETDLRQAALVFDNSREGIMICDSFNRIMKVNQRFTEITGYSEAEAIGENPSILSSGHQSKSFYQEMWDTLLKEGSWKGEIWNRRKNGEAYPENLSISAVRGADGRIQEFVAILADISYEKEQERKLERMAHYDALTGLPNRFLLSDRITQAIANVTRTNTTIAIMFIDLDGFKAINDDYGHEAGDLLLTVLADRFKHSLRSADTVSRIGGDEFIVVSTQGQEEDMSPIVDRLLSASTESVSFQNANLQVSSSIGVVYYTPSEHGSDYGSEQLIRMADQAMYHAKELGKNRVHVYEWGEPQDEFNIDQAIKNHELELYYQPKIDFSNDSPPSFEALIRWNHPEKGTLPPAAFLHHITTSKNQITLANFVLHEALNFIQEIQQQTQVNTDVSINVDSSFLLQEGLANQMHQLFEDEFVSLKPNNLTLEILESSALGDMEDVVQAIIDMNKVGVKMAIDDFGTGHATLNYLKNLPVDIIKIDQGFVRNIFMQPNNISILEAIYSMAEAFEMEVIAEGVETEQHIELLLKLGIDVHQGYGISKPMPAKQAKQWLQEWNKPDYLKGILEVSPEEKNLIKATLYHQVWYQKINNYINGDSVLTKTDTSPKTCQFGRWLNSKSSEAITDKTLFNNIEALHVSVHKSANNAIEAHRHDDAELAEKYLSRLGEQTSQLVAYLQEAEALCALENKKKPSLSS